LKGAAGVVSSENVAEMHCENISSRLTTRLRFLRWLREIFLIAQPPLLFQEGNTLA
jgi:hypothetical protein